MASRSTRPSSYSRVNTQANPNPLVPQILTYRGPYSSPQHLPDPRFLSLLGNKMPFAFVLFDSATLPGGVVGPQQTQRGATSQQPGCWITHLVASSLLVGGGAGNFAAMFYDTEREAIWSTMPIDFSNGQGSAQFPFFLKKPYLLPDDGQLQSKVTNLSTVNNIIQIVAWGLRDDGQS
jgi:hypothetical protein